MDATSPPASAAPPDGTGPDDGTQRDDDPPGERGSLAIAVLGSLMIAAAVTFLALIITVAIAAPQVESNGTGDDMSGLWVVAVCALVLITVGPASLAISFAVITRRMQIPSRGRWAGVVGAVLVVAAVVVTLVLRAFLRDRGVGTLAWPVAVAAVAVAVSSARLVTRYSATRREWAIAAAGLAAIAVSVVIGSLNADRHERAVSYRLIERRDVTLALPVDGAAWTVVDIASPTGHRARDNELSATLRDRTGREVTLEPFSQDYEPCLRGCPGVATLGDGRVVREVRLADAPWYLVDAEVGSLSIRSDEPISPADAAAVFDDLAPVSIDEWLDADRALGDARD